MITNHFISTKVPLFNSSPTRFREEEGVRAAN
jgi:hypothetical protein